MFLSILMCAAICACQQESENPTDTVYYFVGEETSDNDQDTTVRVSILFNGSKAYFKYGEFRIELNAGITYAYDYYFDDGRYVFDLDYTQTSFPSYAYQEMYVEFTETELKYVTVIYSAEDGSELDRMVLNYEALN